MRFLAIIFLYIFFYQSGLFGQANEEKENSRENLISRIKSISFFKDNEYSNSISGSFHFEFSLRFLDQNDRRVYPPRIFYFQPELVYSPSGKVTIRAGTHLLKYSGANKFSQIRPVFSTSLNISEKTTLTLGTISGCEKHLLFDPDFNRERLYTDNYARMVFS